MGYNYILIIECCLFLFVGWLLQWIYLLIILFQAFIASDITFAMKPYFRGPFCSQDVREGLVVAFVKHVCTVCNVRSLFLILNMVRLKDCFENGVKMVENKICAQEYYTD